MPFKYPTLAPYKGQNGAVGTYPTVADYLKAMRALKTTNFTYRYAWQEVPAAVWTLPPLAGVLVIGVAWPLTLGVMRSMGLVRPPAVAAKPAPAPVVAAAVKPVSGVRLAPPQPPPPPKAVPRGDDKEYGGEFYPVVKATHHE